MKKDIHPEYVDCTVTCTCGNTFQTRSTKSEIRVDICNACHPFFTGQQKLIDSGGRVQRFANKFGAATEAVAAREAAKKAERAAAIEAAEAAKKAEREAKAAAKAARAAAPHTVHLPLCGVVSGSLPHGTVPSSPHGASVGSVLAAPHSTACGTVVAAIALLAEGAIASVRL